MYDYLACFDLKISHIKKKVMDDIKTCLSNKFGKEGSLTLTSGKILAYLGTLDYTSKNKVKVSMYEYLDKLLTELPTDMNSTAKTLAANHLFNVNSEAKMPEATAQLFHHLVAKLQYISQHTRQDIQTAVVFYVREYNRQMRMITKSSLGDAIPTMHKRAHSQDRAWY
jgi:hypothetical protein